MPSPEDPVEGEGSAREEAEGPARTLKDVNPGRGGEQDGQTQALGSVTHRGQIRSLLETHGVPH